MAIEDIIHLIFFAAAVQGIILALVFVRKSENEETSYKHLSWIFLTFSMILLHWIAFWRNLYQGPLVGGGMIINNLDFLIGPFIYFFGRSLSIGSFKIRKNQWLHFLPFLIFFIFSINQYLSFRLGPGFPIHLGRPQFLKWYRLIYMLALNTQFIIYGIWIFRKFGIQSPGWLRSVAVLFLSYFSGRLLYTFLVTMDMVTPSIDYVLSFIISGSIFSVAYVNQLQPIFFRQKKSYEKSSLSKDHEHLISQEIVDHITINRRFLDNEYSINLLSQELSIPRHHISQALNQHLGKSFNTMINELRVEESMQILKDPKRTHEKIMGVALASGFNNKVSFNKYFKERTGVSPLEFRKKFSNPLEK